MALRYLKNDNWVVPSESEANPVSGTPLTVYEVDDLSGRPAPSGYDSRVTIGWVEKRADRLWYAYTRGMVWIGSRSTRGQAGRLLRDWVSSPAPRPTVAAQRRQDRC